MVDPNDIRLESLEALNIVLYGKVYKVINLRVLRRGDNPELSKWALNTTTQVPS